MAVATSTALIAAAAIGAVGAVGTAAISAKAAKGSSGALPAPSIPSAPDPAKVAEDQRKEAKRRASLKSNTLLTPASGLKEEDTAKKTLLGG